jgi:isopropylmalate/homocitrate/citramalate synthase
MSCSETHNLTNLRMTCEQSFRQLTGMIALAQGADVPDNVSLSCVSLNDRIQLRRLMERFRCRRTCGNPP